MLPTSIPPRTLALTHSLSSSFPVTPSCKILTEAVHRCISIQRPLATRCGLYVAAICLCSLFSATSKKPLAASKTLESHLSSSTPKALLSFQKYTNSVGLTKPRRFFVHYLGWGLDGAAIATSLAYSMMFLCLAGHVFTSPRYAKARPKFSWAKATSGWTAQIRLGVPSTVMLW